jgi:membrane-bound lytic murein transglycosylase B
MNSETFQFRIAAFGDVVIGFRPLIVSAALLAVSASAAHAGACAAKIDAMQARLDAKLEYVAAHGRTAKQSVAAGMSVQPTPRSIENAETKLGELNQHMIRNVRRAMTRARAADARGNERRCEKELSRVQRALGPST